MKRLNLPPTRRGDGPLAKPAEDINTLTAAMRELEAFVQSLTIQSSVDIAPTISPGGTLLSIRSKPASPPLPRYAFFSIRKDGATGDLYLQGGYVLAGEASIFEDDILLYNAIAEEWMGTEGDLLWLVIEGDGVLSDDVVLPGFNATIVTTAIGAAAPANVLPAYDDSTGKLHVILGQFGAHGFTPGAPGNVIVTFCPGQFSAIRDMVSPDPPA